MSWGHLFPISNFQLPTVYSLSSRVDSMIIHDSIGKCQLSTVPELHQVHQWVKWPVSESFTGATIWHNDVNDKQVSRWRWWRHISWHITSNHISCLSCLPLRHRIVTIICSKTWESVQSEFSQWKKQSAVWSLQWNEIIKWSHASRAWSSWQNYAIAMHNDHGCNAIRFKKKWQLLQVFKSNLFQNVFFTTHCCLSCLPLRHRIVTIICSKTWESVQSEFSQWKNNLQSGVCSEMKS